jgi:hypothetical protein
VRKIPLLALISLIFALSACGGGGSSSLAGSGGSGGNGGSGGIASAGPNVATITVDAGPTNSVGVFNTPFVTVTICAPGSTTNCQTIDHIEVDTGSYGLRIISTVINSTLLSALPAELTPGFTVPIVECTMFGDGYSWGSMRTADLAVSSETAAGVPIQVIGDQPAGNVPATCSNTGPSENSVATFGANGIIGLGPFAQDCGTACANGTGFGFYWSCPSSGAACTETQVPLNMQAANPVTLFMTDNNGVIVEMPSIPDAGALTSSGALVFGIGTQGNNSLGNATVLPTDTGAGFITVNYKNTSYPHSFIDSGSNLYYFNDSTLTTCSLSGQSFFCPATQQSLTAINIGANNTQSTVTFKVASASSQFNNNPSFEAFDNVAAPNSDAQGFDFGMPFFYGRFVYTAIEGKNTAGGGMGPYFAY